jgi:thiamine biosynthesis lipoprotein
VRSTVSDTATALAADATVETIVGRHIVHVMGTVVSFDLRDPVPQSAFTDAVAALHEADQVFSLYRPDSDITRLARGEVGTEDCHPDVDEVLSLAAIAADMTDGYFSAYPCGSLDPTGIVKGWAIQRASRLLDDAGSRRHAVNGGGDVQLAGCASAEPWRIGIADPYTPGAVAVVADCRDGAIATSGTAERGPHIMNPLTGRPAEYFGSVSVTAPTLIEADVFATAAFARGESAIDWLEAMPGVEALFIGPGTRLTATTRFPLSTRSAGDDLTSSK